MLKNYYMNNSAKTTAGFQIVNLGTAYKYGTPNSKGFSQKQIRRVVLPSGTRSNWNVYRKEEKALYKDFKCEFCGLMGDIAKHCYVNSLPYSKWRHPMFHVHAVEEKQLGEAEGGEEFLFVEMDQTLASVLPEYAEFLNCPLDINAVSLF